jgi:hypothetical protein
MINKDKNVYTGTWGPPSNRPRVSLARPISPHSPGTLSVLPGLLKTTSHAYSSPVYGAKAPDERTVIRAENPA